MSKLKLTGGILMILGTSIGAGMLALPVATAHENYLMSLTLLTLSWGAMTIGAFALLKVNMWLPEDSNLISMAESTLGLPGKLITWLVYLLLLYSLLCAYIAGSSDIVHTLLVKFSSNTPQWLATILTVLILGYIVYRGIYSVDMMNRALMSTKLIILALLLTAILPHIKQQNLLSGTYHLHSKALMVMITSFGYAIIIPSLRSYFKSSITSMRKVIIIGSIIPFIIYALWITAIQGVIPRIGLLKMLTSGHTTSMLITATSQFLHNPWLAKFAALFISICAITSFLGVALCLTDFIADGLKIKKNTIKGINIYLLTFIPPLIIVLYAPNIFVIALRYAGILCIVLLIILPLIMLYSGRYIKKLPQHSCRHNQ